MTLIQSLLVSLMMLQTITASPVEFIHPEHQSVLSSPSTTVTFQFRVIPVMSNVEAVKLWVEDRVTGHDVRQGTVIDPILYSDGYGNFNVPIDVGFSDFKWKVQIQKYLGSEETSVWREFTTVDGSPAPTPAPALPAIGGAALSVAAGGACIDPIEFILPGNGDQVVGSTTNFHFCVHRPLDEISKAEITVRDTMAKTLVLKDHNIDLASADKQSCFKFSLDIGLSDYKWKLKVFFNNGFAVESYNWQEFSNLAASAVGVSTTSTSSKQKTSAPTKCRSSSKSTKSPSSAAKSTKSPSATSAKSTKSPSSAKSTKSPSGGKGSSSAKSTKSPSEKRVLRRRRPRRDKDDKSSSSSSAKSTKAPTHPSTKAPVAKSTKAPTHPSTKAPTRPSTKAPEAKSTKSPTRKSTKAPTTAKPTKRPTASPSSSPSNRPSSAPSSNPSTAPSSRPSASPSSSPSTSQPTTRYPTFSPVSSGPTDPPSHEPSSYPSTMPSRSPSSYPSYLPSNSPTDCPKCECSCPTEPPSPVPTEEPTRKSIAKSTKSPSSSAKSTKAPSSSAKSTKSPSSSAKSTKSPSSAKSTKSPSSAKSTKSPSSAKSTKSPSAKSTKAPIGDICDDESEEPSASPSETMLPSAYPSTQPSTLPSSSPSLQPSGAPSETLNLGTPQPSGMPSETLNLGTPQPSGGPSSAPSTTVSPSLRPSRSPSSEPSVFPSWVPSVFPTDEPECPTGQDTADCNYGHFPSNAHVCNGVPQSIVCVGIAQLGLNETGGVGLVGPEPFEERGLQNITLNCTVQGTNETELVIFVQEEQQLTGFTFRLETVDWCITGVNMRAQGATESNFCSFYDEPFDFNTTSQSVFSYRPTNMGYSTACEPMEQIDICVTTECG